MSSALQHQALTDRVSDEAIEAARADFIEEEAANIIKMDLFVLFADCCDAGTEMLHKLWAGDILVLIGLQQQFREAMKNEARIRAACRWNATREALAIQRIQDGRAS